MMQRRKALLRRRSFAYAISMMTGIVSAYTVLECGKVLSGALLMLSYIGICCYLRKAEEITHGDESRMLSMIIMGAMLFAYSYMDLRVTDVNDISSISGRIIGIERSDERIMMTVKVDRPVNGRILCSYYGDASTFIKKSLYDVIGSTVRMHGKLKIPAGRRNPDCFDYARYLKSKGISYCFTAKRVESISGNDNIAYRIKRSILQRREAFENEFTGDQSYGLIKGVIFGDKNDLDEETYEEFIENNTAHILAVSGLHIGFILAALRVLTKSRKTLSMSMMILAVMLTYGEMTLWNISTIRSVLIASMGILAFYFKRPFDLLSALSVSAVLILAVSPYQLFNAGFQMSFLAVTGIAFLSVPLKFFIGEFMASIFAVQIAMLPYIAMIFNRFNPISAFVNIPVVFIAGIITPLSVFTIGIGTFTEKYPELLIISIKSTAQLMKEVNRHLNLQGAFSGRAMTVNPGMTFFLYALLFFACSETLRVMLLRGRKRFAVKLIILMLVPSIVIGISFRNEFLNDEIVFIDVGQGDATHMRAGGKDILFDGGGNRNYNVGKQILAPYFLKNRASSVDMNFLTHLHTDHYKGSTELGEDLYIGRRLISEKYEGTKENVKKSCYLKMGDTVNIVEDVKVKILWTGEMGDVSDQEISENNEMNMVMMIYYKGTKIMITGDLLENDEQDMLKYYSGTDELKCDVLKVAHHGSKSSSCDEFIDEADPDIAVIQVGENNMYGHPNTETIKKLDARGIKVLRNDQNGAVGLDIRNGKIRTDTMIG